LESFADCLLNITLKQLVFLFQILEVLGSNLSVHTGYHN